MSFKASQPGRRTSHVRPEPIAHVVRVRRECNVPVHAPLVELAQERAHEEGVVEVGVETGDGASVRVERVDDATLQSSLVLLKKGQRVP